MATQELLNKEVKVIGNEVIIVDTIQKKITRKELEQELYGYRVQQQQILGQISEFRSRHELIEMKAKEVENLLLTFEERVNEGGVKADG